MPLAVDHPADTAATAPNPSAQSAQVVTSAIEAIKNSGWWCNRHGLVGAKRVIAVKDGVRFEQQVCAKCQDPVTWNEVR